MADCQQNDKLSLPLTDSSCLLGQTHSTITQIYVSDVDFEQQLRSYSSSNRQPHKKKRERENFGDPADVDGYRGPWATYRADSTSVLSGPTQEEVDIAKNISHANPNLPSLEPKIKSSTGEYSIFHGSSNQECDGYLKFRPTEDLSNRLSSSSGANCIAPKKIIHTWTGHTQGVNAVRLFPRTGHLLLSCSLDHKIKLWDYFKERKCLRTFVGHNKGVRDVTFSPDGSKFMSCSYDRFVKLWDTESGQCIQQFQLDQLPFVIKFHPTGDHDTAPTEFLVGCNDNVAYQFDLRSNEMVHAYEGHLAPINSITFTREANQFITTSDDKTVRIWDCREKKILRYISKPSMSSISSVSLHPTENVVACQSAKGQILIYESSERFGYQKKKFFGHRLNGYGCPVGFSPDGTVIMSGDGEGGILFWEWERALFLRKIKVHDKVVMGCEWHPLESSQVVTCSWDGTIKLLA